MKITKVLRNTVVIAGIAVATAVFSGCGGVSEAQMQELNDLRNQVTSLENEANQLRDERSKLEREIAEKNAKLQQCARDKAETQANLEKLPK